MAATSEALKRRVLTALCVTTLVSYGVLYYAFPVLLPDIVADTGWSTTAVTVAFSVGGLAGAGAGVVVGRIIQGRGPRRVMTGASLLGAASIGGVGLAPTYGVFLLGWIAVGVATSGLFYPPAFAALTGWFGHTRVRAITILTLAAGLASTIFAPITAELAGRLDWRETYLVLAGVLLAVTLPLHAVALRGPWPGAKAGEHGVRDRTIVASLPFVMLTAGCTLVMLASFGSLVHLVPLLRDRGLGPEVAAWALGLGGAGQVAGRVFFPWLVKVASPRLRSTSVSLSVGVTVVLLVVVPGTAAVLIAASVVAGVVRGIFTLVSATVVADHWGAERYAALNGVFNAPLTVAVAIAPGFGAVLLAWSGGYTASYLLFAALAGAGALLCWLGGEAPNQHGSTGSAQVRG